jgi:uncharacterized protein YkwD
MKDYRKLAKEVFDRINSIRAKPSAYVQDFVKMSKKFNGNVYDGHLRTQEGAAAVLEVIDFLSTQASLPAIELHKGLQKSVEDFANELSQTGGVSHKDKNGEEAAARISKVVNWSGSMSECLSLGSETAEDIVNWWIIDDGATRRGHRKNIFAKSSKYGGVGCASHPKYRVVAILDLIEEIAEETKSEGKFDAKEPGVKPAYKAHHDYKKLAQEVFLRINLIRGNPKGIIPEFIEMVKKFKGNLYDNVLRTYEGAAAVEEAIEFVKGQLALPPIELHEGLRQVAEDFANELGATGNFSHIDENGHGPSERIGKVVKVSGSLSECLSLGSDTADDIVNSWIIDDGNTNRGHRRNLFSANSKLGGVGCAAHPKMRVVAVFNAIDGIAK